MEKNKIAKLKLNKEKRDKAISKIKNYFLNEREEELGDLGASFILDFFLNEIAPEVYNQGVYDSYAFLNEKIEDLLGIQK